MESFAELFNTVLLLHSSNIRLHMKTVEQGARIDAKYVRRKNQETGYFQLLPLTQFFGIYKMVGCIPDVLTLLLTPILTYIHMVYVRVTYMS